MRTGGVKSTLSITGISATPRPVTASHPRARSRCFQKRTTSPQSRSLAAVENEGRAQTNVLVKLSHTRLEGNHLTAALSLL